MIITYGIGDRVVHRLTAGRIRGTVEEIRIARGSMRVYVRIDGLAGRILDYKAENLEREGGTS